MKKGSWVYVEKKTSKFFYTSEVSYKSQILKCDFQILLSLLLYAEKNVNTQKFSFF